MSSSVKATGFDSLTTMFQKAAEVLSDEATMRDIAHAALRPVAEDMYARIQKRSSATADDIRIADEESGDGTIKVAVGFGTGKGGRSFVAQFLEYGTATRRAYPFMRPAYDAAGGAAGLSKVVAEQVAVLLSAVLG